MKKLCPLPTLRLGPSRPSTLKALEPALGHVLRDPGLGGVSAHFLQSNKKRLLSINLDQSMLKAKKVTRVRFPGRVTPKTLKVGIHSFPA